MGPLAPFLLLSILGLVAAISGACASPGPTLTPAATPTLTPTPSPTTTPVPTSTPMLFLTPSHTPTSSALPDPTATPRTPTPTSGAVPSTLGLSTEEIQGLSHAGIKAAMLDLQQRLGVEVGLTQLVRIHQVTWGDTSLGCREPGKVYLQVLTPGIWLVLAHQGQEYDYRTTNSLAVLCVQAERVEPLDSKPLEGVWSRLAPVPTPRSEVAAATLSGKIYVSGGFGPGATANEEYDPINQCLAETRTHPPRGEPRCGTGVSREDLSYRGI